MAKGAAGGGEGGAVKTALVVTGGLVLAWLTVESAFKPFLDRLRGAVSRSTDPARDPDEDTAAPAPAPEEDKSPATAAVAAAVASAVAEEKDPAVAEEKDSAVAAAEPSAPPLPAEAVEGEEKGADREVELGEKGEAAVAAKTE